MDVLFSCAAPTETAVAISDFVRFYAENLRGNLFSGFLTLAAFLLSAKTFIVIHLQKEIYSKKHYHDQIRGLRQVKPSLKYYAPLRRLSVLLFWTILTSIAAAIAQVTLGLISKAWAVWICLGLGILAIVLLLISFWVMSWSLTDWFEHLEKEAEEEENGRPREKAGTQAAESEDADNG